MSSAREFYQGYFGRPIDSKLGGGGTFGFSMDQLLAVLQAALNTAHPRLAALDARISQLNTENTSLRNTLQQANSQVRNNSARVSQLVADNANLQSQVNLWNSRVRELEHDKANLQKSAQEQLKINNAYQSNLQSRISSLNTDKENLQNNFQQAIQEIDALKSQLLANKNTLAKSHSEISELKEEIEKLKLELRQEKQKQELKLASIQTGIGLFKQIIATSPEKSASTKQNASISMSNTK